MTWKIGNILLILFGLACGGASAAAETESHGFKIIGDLKYGPDFQHFDYVDPDAPKGGSITLWYQGNFDSVQPFLLKGQPAAGSNPFLPGGSLLTFLPLMVSADDEASAYYGMIAKRIRLPDDRRWVEFVLDPDARFHDGSPITAADVVFSYETLIKDGHPTFRILYGDVAKATASSDSVVRFDFKDDANTRDLPANIAAMPVLSSVYFSETEFTKTTLTPPLGNGLYKIDKVDEGRSIVYQRVAGHWAENKPAMKGRYNFDRIKIDYYRDRDISLEAFFSGQVDFREEFTSKTWATKYDVPPVNNGRVLRETLPNLSPSGFQAWHINTRKAKFEDPRVRQALAYGFDFEWSNTNLFYGLYNRTSSVFQNSELAASGPPSPAELALLEPFRDKLPAEVFGDAYHPPSNPNPGSLRKNLRAARRLLTEAGWTIKDGALQNAAGEPFELEVLSYGKGFERIVLPFMKNLERLGIKGRFRLFEPATYQRRIQTRDFDLTTFRFGLGLTPGVNLRNFFSTKAADIEGSLNYTGVKSPVLDALIEHIVTAKTREDLTVAARALDRVFMWGHYVIPQWNKATHNIAYWDMFGRPEKKPDYALGFLDTWWLDTDKAALLQR